MADKYVQLKDLNGNNLFPITAIYPIGSVYISVNNINPSLYFGGTWERIEDCFLLAAGSNHLAGETGGREDVTLMAWMGATGGAASSLAYQAGNANTHMQNQSFNGYRFTGLTYSGDRGGNWNHNTWVTDQNGSTRETNIMPPYLAVYVWKRTA